MEEPHLSGSCLRWSQRPHLLQSFFIDTFRNSLSSTFETFVSRNKDGEETFGLLVNFERNTNGKNGILISYNLMCAILVMISLVNFLIDPKDSNRAAVLVALILVLATIFNSSQVSSM